MVAHAGSAAFRRRLRRGAPGPWRWRRAVCAAATGKAWRGFVTPLGAKLRSLRAGRGESLKAMAQEIGVSPAYLSALEHGKRGTPTWLLLQRIISHFNIIWDEAEELQRLARLSDPRVVVHTAHLSPAATELANRLAREIGGLRESQIAAILAILDGVKQP